ncbi:MAG: hypothetical protein ACRD5K_16365 [Candidatus Acidiferrales bacterium]
MNTAPTKETILDEILLGLADLFESGSTSWYSIEQDKERPEEFEPLRECLAQMISEGWLAQWRPTKLYRLTSDGYRQLKPRIEVLRVFGKS